MKTRREASEGIRFSKAFEPQRLQEERDQDKFIKVSIKFNKEEQSLLEEIKQLLQQSKDGTAIKQCLTITKAALDDKTKAITEIILNNYRKNKRLGIVDFD